MAEVEQCLQQLEYIVQQREPDLIQEYCDRMQLATEGYEAEVERRTREIITNLETIHKQISDLEKYQNKMIEMSQDVEIYKWRGYKVGRAIKEYSLPFSPLVGMKGSTVDERNQVLLKALVSKYLSVKTTDVDVNPDVILRKEPTFYHHAKRQQQAEVR